MRSLSVSSASAARPWSVILGGLGVLAVMAACGGSAATFPLALSAQDAPRSFAPIHACATEAKLQAVDHPDSVNVQYDSSTWIQYMIQVNRFNMVVVIGDEVPPPDRQKRVDDAKAKGDSLYQCAMARGLAPAGAPVAGGTNGSGTGSSTTAGNATGAGNPTAGAQPGGTPGQPGGEPATGTANGTVSGSVTLNLGPGGGKPAESKSCTRDLDCPSQNCTNGTCQSGQYGAPCHEENNCQGRNCTNGICQHISPGSPCKVNLNCTSATCLPNHTCK